MIDSRVNERAKPYNMPISHSAIRLAAALLCGGTTFAQGRTLDLNLDPEFANPAEPAVTIATYENRTTQEYRVNGNLYLIKVNPAAGPPYYLLDPDGSGEFEWRRHTPTADLQVPQWALVRW